MESVKFVCDLFTGDNMWEMESKVESKQKVGELNIFLSLFFLTKLPGWGTGPVMCS